MLCHRYFTLRLIQYIYHTVSAYHCYQLGPHASVPHSRLSLKLKPSKNSFLTLNNSLSTLKSAIAHSFSKKKRSARVQPGKYCRHVLVHGCVRTRPRVNYLHVYTRLSRINDLLKLCAFWFISQQRNARSRRFQRC